MFFDHYGIRIVWGDSSLVENPVYIVYIGMKNHPIKLCRSTNYMLFVLLHKITYVQIPTEDPV